MNLLKMHEVIKAENEVLKLQSKLQKETEKPEIDRLKMEIIIQTGKVNEKRAKLRGKK